MRYGHFDDEAREYVITRPDTPLPWINYLGSEDYFGILSNTAGGYSFYRDARLRRLMQALIDGEAPVGDYATAIVRRRDITEIQCGFADRSDAERVGARLRAKSVPPSGEWLSERLLRLDERAEVALEDATAGPKTAGPKRTSRPALADHERA